MIKTVCCYCGAFISLLPCADEVMKLSHGMCKKCEDKQMKILDEEGTDEKRIVVKDVD